MPPPHRIAIADASPAFLAAAAAYVASLPGCVIAGTAASADAAPALVRAVRPDVVLLDLGAAPSRALDLVRRLKAEPNAPAVIAMALFHTEEAESQARGAGADALVGKEAFVSGLADVLPGLLAPHAA